MFNNTFLNMLVSDAGFLSFSPPSPKRNPQSRLFLFSSHSIYNQLKRTVNKYLLVTPDNNNNTRYN